MATIGITGSHCTGKTTLLRTLEIHGLHQPGIGWHFIDSIGSTVVAAGLPVGELSTADTYCKFLAVHLHALRDAQDHDSIAFIDRTPFDLLAYMLANGNASPCLIEAIGAAAAAMVPAYKKIFYLPIEFPLQPSAYRSSDPAYRTRVDDLLQEVLAAHGAPVVRLSGNTEARLNEALRHL